MQTEDQDQPQDGASAQELILFERQQRERIEYQTKYFYLPLQGSTISSQVNDGFPAGEIFPLVAPYGMMDVRLVPEGAQMLRVVSPSTGIPATLAKSAPAQTHVNPAFAALQKEVAELKGQTHAPANIAIYLHPTQPLIDALLRYEAHRGAVEVKILRGFNSATFKQKRINHLLFGPLGERPTTASALRAKMNAVIEQADAITGQSDGADEAAKIMGGAAREILKSVDTCEGYCQERMRLRHLALDDPNPEPSLYSAPRYSWHDERCLEFAGIAKRAEIKRQLIEDQRQAMEAFPKLLTVISERDAVTASAIETLNERLAAAFDRIGDIFERLAPPNVEQPETASRQRKEQK